MLERTYRMSLTASKWVFYGKSFPWWKEEEGLWPLHLPRPHLNRNICILVENMNSEWFVGLVGSVLPCCHIELTSKDLPLACTPQRYPQASQCVCTGKNTSFSSHICHPFSLIYTSNISLLPSGIYCRNFLLSYFKRLTSWGSPQVWKLHIKSKVLLQLLLSSLSLTGLFSQGKFPNVSMTVPSKSFLSLSVAKPV